MATANEKVCDGLGRNGTLPRFLFQPRQRHARARELGFRDFSSLFLVKENRRQLGNSACCISLTRVTLTSRVFAMDERSQ